MNTILIMLKALVVTAVVCTAAAAQDTMRPEGREGRRGQGDGRGSLMRRLDLTPEQGEAIRQLNRGRKPAMEAAQSRLREANRSLDEAIYADRVDEALVADRVRAVQDAQAEISRIRFQNELAVRKLLTPEQLARFRELREQFLQEREDRRPFERRKDMRRQRQGNPNRPHDEPFVRNDRRPI